MIGHVVWHIRNFAFLLLVTFLLFFTFGISATSCHHRSLILFGFDVLMLQGVGWYGSNFNMGYLQFIKFSGTFGSDNSTNLDYLQLLLGDILTYKIHYPGVIHCNPLYRPSSAFSPVLL